MQERQLIKKIKKEFGQIKPGEKWVFLTKKRILGREPEKLGVSPFSVLFIPIRRPALVVVPLVLMATVLGGLFVYFNFLPQSYQVPIVTKTPEKQSSEEIITSLTELQKSLEKITLGLNDLKRAKNPNQALVMTEIIKATAKNGEEVVDQIKGANRAQSKQVLASLNGVGEAYRELEEIAGNTQTEVIKALIDVLNQGTLTDEDKTRLQKAEEYYNEGEIGEAIFWITRMEAIK